MMVSPSTEMLMRLIQLFSGSFAPTQESAPAPEEIPLMESYIKSLLRRETAGWGSKSDELRTRSSDYGDRVDREFTRLRSRQF